MGNIKKYFNYSAAFAVIAFPVFVSFFGRDFLTMQCRPFMMLFILSVIFILVNREFYLTIFCRNYLARLWILFFIYSNIYVLLSYTVFPDFFDFPLGYTPAMIPRHCYFIYYGISIGSMIYCIISFLCISERNINHLQRVLDIISVYILYRAVSGKIILPDGRAGNTFSIEYFTLLMMLSYTVMIFQSGKYVKGAIAASIIAGIIYYIPPISGSMKLIILVFLVMFFFHKIILKLSSLWPISIIVITLIFSYIYMDVNRFYKLDGNSGVRAKYWKSNMETIYKTGCLGVGFGAAYFERNVFRNLSWAGFGAGIDHPEVLALPGDRYINALFVIAQHNSFLNIYYRLGFPGFCIFLLLNIGIIYRFRKIVLGEYKCNNSVCRKICLLSCLFISSVVLITINPGLESPVVFYLYLYIYALSFAYTSKVLYRERVKL